MRKDVMMISAGLMMLAMASCDQTEYREITEDRVVPQPVDTIKVADHFYLDGYLSRTSEDIGGRQLNAVNTVAVAHCGYFIHTVHASFHGLFLHSCR